VEAKLKEEDVARLLANPSGETRADIAGKIAAQHANLSVGERKMAEDIFRVMCKDAEVRVREALSRQLKENPLVPHDVALALAKDVDAVSLPMLQFSDVLSDEDLVEIVKSQSPERAPPSPAAPMSRPWWPTPWSRPMTSGWWPPWSPTRAPT